MNNEPDTPTTRSHQTAVVTSDDDRRSRRRRRHRQFVESRENPSTAPVQQHQHQQEQQQASAENHKSELYIMSQQERTGRISDTSRPSSSRTSPDSKMTVIRPVSVSAQALIPSTWQDTSPDQRQRQRSGSRMTPSITSPSRATVTSPTWDKRHSLSSPTVPMTGGSNFLTINPPSELRVQGTPHGGTRAAIHIIDDFLHNPPRTEPLRQRSLTRGGSRGSGKQREREQRTQRVSRTQVTVGLDHLDNLCRLIEQLSSLRDENTKLKKRCNFLENTRELLKIQNEMLLHERDEYDSEGEDTISLGLSESTLAESHIDDDDVFSHTSSTVMAKPRVQHRRSQSVGSIDLIDVLPALEKPHLAPHDSPFRNKFKKSIKHTRNTIKKVFGSKKDGIDYHSGRPVPTIRTTEGYDKNVKTSLSSDRSSTSPSQSEPGRGSEEHHIEQVVVPETVKEAQSEARFLSEPTITREVVSDVEADPVMRRRQSIPESHLLVRRKSSPTLTLSKNGESPDLRRPKTPELPRSSTTPQFGDYSPKDDKMRGRTAWGKVKDIIHTRKDSLKKRNRKSMDDNRRSMTDAIFDRKSAEPSGSPTDDETLKQASSSDTMLNELDKATEKALPSHGRIHPALQGTQTQTTKALQELVGNLSEEFNRKMME